MNQRNKTAASGSYRPWGQVRRKSFIARLMYTAMMTVLGLAVLAAAVLLIVFAASVAVVVGLGLGLLALTAMVTRKTANIHVRTEKPDAKGLFVARKSGSTWTVY